MCVPSPADPRRRALGMLLLGLGSAVGFGAGLRCAQATPPVPAPVAGWQDVPLNPRKKPTVYRLAGPSGEVPGGAPGGPWIEARADDAASLFLHPAAVDLAATPLLAWRWRLLADPRQPDISATAREDAAARVVLCFAGDRRRLSRTERMTLALADRLAGRPTPFATLMYVVAPGLPVGTLVPNPYTRRIQMLVVDAEAAAERAGWRQFRRDVVADYRRAWGEPPGRLDAYGVMTDSDNTRSRSEAVYAGLRFLAPG